MNKKELVSQIQKNLNAPTLAEAERTLEAFLEGVRAGVANDGKVQLVGFGTFSVAERKARKGVNPQTGKSIDIPASKTVKFKVSKEMSF
jgi:DNA-binding protein HU-beta